MTIPAVAFLLLLSPGNPPQETESLRYAFEKGQVFRYRTVQEVAFGKSRHVLRDTFRCEVYSLGEEGDARIIVTFENVAARGEVHHRFEFDSEKDKPPYENLTKRALSRLVGQTFTMVVHPLGTVTDVTGAARIRDHLLKGIQDEREVGLVEQFISFMLNGQVLTSRMQQIWMVLPPNPVPPGKAYTSTVPFHLPVVGEMRAVSRSSFEATEGGGIVVTHRPRILPIPGGLELIPISESKGAGRTTLSGPNRAVSEAAMNFSLKMTAGNRQFQVTLDFKAERVEE